MKKSLMTGLIVLVVGALLVILYTGGINKEFTGNQVRLPQGQNGLTYSSCFDISPFLYPGYSNYSECKSVSIGILNSCLACCDSNFRNQPIFKEIAIIFSKTKSYKIVGYKTDPACQSYCYGAFGVLAGICDNQYLNRTSG